MEEGSGMDLLLTEMINLDTKQDTTIICLQETFRFKDTTRLEAQGWKTVITHKQ